MNILYWAPNCGSGIEQIGFVYLFLLKSLGHTIDFTNTQSMNIHKKELKDLVHSNKYDYVIFNEATENIFERTDYKNYPKDKVFNICHSSISVPTNVTALSLNYSYHMRTAQSFPITYPLAYPFLYKKLSKKSFYERKYKMAFIGRYHFTKFHKDVEAFLIENNITMDYSVVSNNYEGNIPSTIQFNNLNVDEIYDLLLDTQYLLLPSTTECLSLVVGEAQVCGCIPIVLETEMLEHDQFSLSHKCFDIASFNQAIQTIYKDKLLVDVDPSSIRHSQPWHIERVRKQLSLLFGDEHKDGIVNILDYDGLVDYINELPLKNAEIITKEALSSTKKKFTLTLTDKCNKNCEFCYENKVRKGISLNESTLYTQIDRIMGEKVDKVIGFFGGEPFIELDLMKKAVEKLKQYKSNNLTTLSFITNGILLNSPDVMSFLQECKNDGFNPYITISYDGVQNKIANLGSNINKLVSMLGERNVRINYTLSKVNVKDIVTNYKLAESLGVKNVHYRPVHGDFVEDPSLVELYRNNMIELFEYLKTAQSMPYDLFPFIISYKLWDISKVEAYNYIYQPRANVGCNMGFSHLTYSMDDEIYYCHRLQFYQAFIKDVKEANQYMKDNNGTFSYAGCDTCPTLKQCGMCSIINEIYTGDKNIPHPTLCKFQIVVHELTELFFKMFHPTFQEGYVGP